MTHVTLPARASGKAVGKAGRSDGRKARRMKPSGKSGGKPDNKITGLCIEQRPVCLWSGGSSPRRDAPEVAVGMVAVPKTVQKPPSPRRDATEVLVGMVAVPSRL